MVVEELALRRAGRRRQLVVLGAVAALVVALAAASELALPAVARHRLTNSLSQRATDVHVDLRAEPALELLWGRANRLSVSMGELRTGQRGGGDLLSRASGVGRLDATVRTLLVGGLRIDDVSVRKRGSQLLFHAAVRHSEIARLLPRPVEIDERAAGANTLAFTVTVNAFGHRASSTALVRAQEGRLVIQAPGLSLLKLTLFSDPRLSVDSIRSTRPTRDRYEFFMRAHLT